MSSGTGTASWNTHVAVTAGDPTGLPNCRCPGFGSGCPCPIRKEHVKATLEHQGKIREKENGIVNLNLTIYMVRSRDGKWFRSVGYGGGGKSWVSDPADAKMYAKPGPAKSRVTWWAKNYPQYGVPDIVEITAMSGKVIDETARVAKAVAAEERKKVRDHQARAKYQADLEKLQRTLPRRLRR